ncbi:MAG TPA: RNA polymerase sigma factor [Nevskia sp.]|nr:RNA polymerase sigma factor [Nevskia sp.]
MLGQVDLLGVFVDYQIKLKRLLAGRLKSPQTAEDLTQDLYFKLPRVAEQFPTRDDAQRYLVRMALNAALDHQRVEGRRAELLQGMAEQADSVTASPEHELVSRGEVEQLEHALKELPAKCRDVLYMSRVQGMTHAEIAAELGVSKSLVDKYAVRALVHCREWLNRAEQRRKDGRLAPAEAETGP